MNNEPQEEEKNPLTHPFYGNEIIRRREQEYINGLLKKYRHLEVNDELQSKIWNELQMEKHAGRITIPFKITMRKDMNKDFPDYIEIILDTKV